MLRRVALVCFGLGGLTATGCGDDGATADATVTDARPDSPPSQCQPIPATGTFNRRAGNPRLLPVQTSTDGKIDLAIADPDVRWTGSQYVVYYQTPRGASFTDPAATQVIRRATSADRMTWTVDAAPVFTVGEAGSWDRTHTEMPTVIENPDAPADRRFLMMYAGASRAFPHPSYPFPDYGIGAAFSADGVTFTRVPAAMSPHGMDGLVLTGAQTFPGTTGAIVSDPELALVDGTYHLWFSSFACDGTNCANVTDLGISHATSPDGIAWTIAEAPVRSLLRASADRKSGGSRPSVIYDAVHCRFEMWLTNDAAGENDNQPTELDNMVGVWHAESRDGVTWSINYSRARDLTWTAAAPDPGEKLGLRAGADVADKDGGRIMLYVGYDDQNVPPGFTVPDRTQAGERAGVMTLNVATRDLP